MRQAAEYIAKGVQKGDDLELDKKFSAQLQELSQLIRDREHRLKTLQSNSDQKEISKELSNSDPYGLNKDQDGKKLPDEPNAQFDYWKGLKWGQTLQYHDEKIANRIIEMAPNDDVGKGLRDGQEIQKKDKAQNKERSISPEIWDEMKMDITQPAHDFDKGKSQDKDKG